jgi:integrase/recombinase XerD
LEWITRYLTDARPSLVAQAKPGPAATLLFLTKSGLPFTPGKLLHLIRSYAATHHLPASTTTHSLRHACATGMLRGGASIRHVQEMLGHSSLRTTQIYTHIVKDDLKAIHAKTAPSERRAITEAPEFEFTNWRPRKQKKPRAARKKGNPRRKSPRKPPKEKPPDTSSS